MVRRTPPQAKRKAPEQLIPPWIWSACILCADRGVWVDPYTGCCLKCEAPMDPRVNVTEIGQRLANKGMCTETA